jgi:hypothetical protein
MPEQSTLAEFGFRLGLLGSAAALAFAAPLANGNYSEAAHTDPSRIGGYYQRGLDPLMGFVANGVDSTHIAPFGLETVNGTVGAPSQTFFGDRTSGHYLPAAGQLGIVAGGLECARAYSGGGFQIGGTYGTDPGANNLLVGGNAIATSFRVPASVTSTVPGAINDFSLIYTINNGDLVFHTRSNGGNKAFYWYGSASTNFSVLTMTLTGDGDLTTRGSIRPGSAAAGTLYMADATISKAAGNQLNITGSAGVPIYVDLGSARTALLSNNTGYSELALGGGAGAIGRIQLYADATLGDGSASTLLFTSSSDAWEFKRYGIGPATTWQRVSIMYNGTLETFATYKDGGVQIGGVYGVSPGAGNLSVSGNVSASGNVSGTRIIAGNGSVGSPSFSFVGSTSAGLYQSSTNIIAVSTAGTHRMRWDHTGGVYIGDAASSWEPGAAKLAISGGEIQFQSTSNTFPTNNSYGRITVASAGDICVAPRTNGVLTKFRVINGVSPTTSVGNVFIVDNTGAVRAGMTAVDGELAMSMESTSTGVDAYASVKAQGNSSGIATLRGYGSNYATTLWGGSQADCSRLNLGHGSGLYGFITAQTYLRLGVASAECLYLSANQIEAKIKLMIPNGTAALPGLSFFSAVNAGIYLSVTGGPSYNVGISTAGTEKTRFWGDGGVQIGGTYTSSPGAGNLTLSGIINAGDGSAAAPTYSFILSPQAGLYSGSTNSVSMVTSAALRQIWTASRTEVYNAFRVSTGTVGAPSIQSAASTNTGLYFSGATVNLAAAGVVTATFGSSISLYGNGAEALRIYTNGGAQLGGTYGSAPAAASLQLGDTVWVNYSAQYPFYAIAASAGNVYEVRVRNTDAAVNGSARMTVVNDASAYASMFVYSSTGGAGIDGIDIGNLSIIMGSRDLLMRTNGAYALHFATNLAERMRIFTDGGVKIGSTFSASLGAGTLQVEGLTQFDAANNRAITSVSGTLTLNNTHSTVLVDASAGPVVVNLPDSSTPGYNGRIYVVKKIDNTANAVTITRGGSDLIDGATTAPITTQYTALTVQAHTTSLSWNII